MLDNCKQPGKTYQPFAPILFILLNMLWLCNHILYTHYKQNTLAVQTKEFPCKYYINPIWSDDPKCREHIDSEPLYHNHGNN